MVPGQMLVFWFTYTVAATSPCTVAATATVTVYETAPVLMPVLLY
jgi:hypothetical protein